VAGDLERAASVAGAAPEASLARYTFPDALAAARLAREMREQLSSSIADRELVQAPRRH
jgi:hypothetical protein